MKRGYLIVPVLVVLLAACSAGSSGSPAASGVRTIDVTATDQLRFEPAEFNVKAGETVRFQVHNTGQIAHEFVIGDAEEQTHHEEEMRAMASGMKMHDEENAISIPPGETKTLEYTFGDRGELLAGCHEPGHDDAGMIAKIHVE